MARIRSIKPEIHMDEAVGALSDSAYRLFTGLITQADDHGRQKGSPQLLSALIWPYREKPAAEVEEHLAELEREGLIIRYFHGGKPFIALPTWSDHQRIDNAGKSKIPAPEDADGEGSPLSAAARREPPRAAAGGDQGSRIKERRGAGDAAAGASAGHPAPDSLPGDFPDQLKPTVETVLVTLQRVAGTKRAKPVHRLPVARAIQALPDRDHRREVGRFEQHWVFGNAERRPLKDVVMAFRNWLERSDRIAPKAVEPDRSGYDAHAVKVVL